MCNTPSSLPLLHILQGLLLLESDTERSCIIWEALESFTQRAVLMESPNEGNVERAHNVSIDQLRTALTRLPNTATAVTSEPCIILCLV